MPDEQLLALKAAGASHRLVAEVTALTYGRAQRLYRTRRQARAASSVA